MTPNPTPGARFGVVIVNYNGGDMLLAAVDSALAEGVHPHDIVVVDNGSRDTSTSTLTQRPDPPKTILNGCNAGFARAVNAGLRALTTEFVLLLNNDAELEPGALAAFASAFDRDPQLAIAGGQLRYPDGRLQTAFAPLPSLTEELFTPGLMRKLHPERYRRSSTTDATLEVESAYGACLAVRSSALATFGLLDEDFFFYYEEVDWCRRARLAGFRIAYVPSARAIHRWGHTANKFRTEARIELQRSRLLYFRKSSSRAAYLAISFHLIASALFNVLTNALAVVLTLGLAAKLRTKLRGYSRILTWHLTGRPETWGLPDKCPPAPR